MAAQRGDDSGDAVLRDDFQENTFPGAHAQQQHAHEQQPRRAPRPLRRLSACFDPYAAGVGAGHGRAADRRRVGGRAGSPGNDGGGGEDDDDEDDDDDDDDDEDDDDGNDDDDDDDDDDDFVEQPPRRPRRDAASDEAAREASRARDRSVDECVISPMRRRARADGARADARAEREPRGRKRDYGWRTVAGGEALPDEQAAAFIEALGTNNARGRGYTTAGPWKAGRGEGVWVRGHRCLFKGCPHRLREVRCRGVTRIEETTAEEMQHGDHVEDEDEVHGVPGHILALLASPSKMLLPPKKMRAYLRSQPNPAGAPGEKIVISRALEKKLVSKRKAFLRARKRALRDGAGEGS
jgi:hypothetical protein